MNWLITQLESPSTHNALAALSSALIPILPPNVGLIATGVFAILATIIPEHGETK